MADKDELCACGKPLHYQDADNERRMKEFVAKLGRFIPVNGPDGKSYLVDRHYIALHGIRAYELPLLAKRFGWKVIS